MAEIVNDPRVQFISRLLEQNFHRVEGPEPDACSCGVLFRVWGRNRFRRSVPHVTLAFDKYFLERRQVHFFAHDTLKALQMAKRALISPDPTRGEQGTIRVAEGSIDVLSPDAREHGCSAARGC